MNCHICLSLTDPTKLSIKEGFRHCSSLFELSESALRGCKFCIFLQNQLSAERWDDLSRCKLGRTPSVTSTISLEDAKIKAKILRETDFRHNTPIILQTQDSVLHGIRRMKVVLKDIYKDSCYSYHFESEFELFASEESPFAIDIKGRPISHSSSSNESFNLATSWLQGCIQNHPQCGFQDPRPLPSRVIDVGFPTDSSDPFLFISNGQVGNWLTLSHCWGQNLTFCTTSQNLQQFTYGIPFKELPATFQDAITITRRLKYRYIWIDALCIIQDSKDDWQNEAGKMHEIYRYSTLTIVADASTDSSCGIFASGDSQRQKYRQSVNVLDFGVIDPSPLMEARSSLEVGLLKQSPVGRRGWTLQEDILSPRVLKYSAEQLFWACQALRCCEAEPHADNWLEDKYFRRLDTKDSWFDKNLGDDEIDVYFKFWREVLVNSFTQRSLTYHSDLMPAISGLAKEIELRTNCTYVAGLWSEDMPTALLWKTDRVGKRPTQYVAPSWSWASIVFQQNEDIGPRQTYSFIASPDNSIYDATVLDIYVNYATTDPFGQIEAAFMSIAGYWRYVDDFITFPPPFFEHSNDLRSIWDRQSGRLDFLLHKQIVCNLDEAPSFESEVTNIFGQGNIYLQILRDPFGVVHALILAPVENARKNKIYKRIGIAKIPQDDGMANDWEMDKFLIA